MQKSQVTIFREELWPQLLPLLSSNRLERYGNEEDRDELDALARYLWNVALCEALYPSLQSLEISLRNSIHNRLTATKGTAFWFNTTGLLREVEAKSVLSATLGLERQGKIVQPERIVAELNFGFWTGLLSRHYEASIIIPIIASAFPNLPRQCRTRFIICQRFNQVKHLRNRVFHHEPIWHWNDLTEQHHNVMQAIGWISHPKQQLTIVANRFPDVYQRGWRFYRQEIERNFRSSFGTCPYCRRLLRTERAQQCMYCHKNWH